MRFFYFIFFVTVNSLGACIEYENTLPYDFNEKDAVKLLAPHLEEISGIVYKDSSLIYAINDEEGIIYEVNYLTGKSRKYIDFKVKGDFEGIALLGDFFYVLKSNGTIYQVGKDGKYTKFSFPDSKGFDFEGITADVENNQLIVSCKHHPKENDYIWIYSFSLEKMEYNQGHYFNYLKKKKLKGFTPSGIAFNSKGDMYLISSKSYTVAAFSKDKKYKGKGQVSFYRYPQIEGITFAPDGTLILASEKGEQNSAKLIVLPKQ